MGSSKKMFLKGFPLSNLPPQKGDLLKEKAFLRLWQMAAYRSGRFWLKSHVRKSVSGSQWSLLN